MPWVFLGVATAVRIALVYALLRRRCPCQHRPTDS